MTRVTRKWVRDILVLSKDELWEPGIIGSVTVWDEYRIALQALRGLHTLDRPGIG